VLPLRRAAEPIPSGSQWGSIHTAKEPEMESHVENQPQATARPRVSWNKGKLIGQKAPLRLKEIYAIRVRLQLEKRVRELALFNLAIDSKLRGCDLVKLRVCDVAQVSRVMPRTMVMQQKTQRPVQFELTEQTRDAVGAWIPKHSSSQINACSQAECMHPNTSRLANMNGCSSAGWRRLDSIQPHTVPTR
jgi:hypothetical protein